MSEELTIENLQKAVETLKDMKPRHRSAPRLAIVVDLSRVHEWHLDDGREDRARRLLFPCRQKLLRSEQGEDKK